MTQSKITRDHLEELFAAFQGKVENKVHDRRQTIMAVAGGVGLVLLILFFLLGRRSGKKKTTIVEIRRV